MSSHAFSRFWCGSLRKCCSIELEAYVTQVGSIKNEYRVFDMEVVAGEPNLEAEVMQHRARFRLDFSKVHRC